MTMEDEHGALTVIFSYISATSDTDKKDKQAILVDEEGEGWRERKEHI